ncbi:hypothetical protein [Duganella sp. HH101]|uniref:hypothetical protein n=1 Tax=Duganella sp. HH101 TaxID=1781066 RepID=UPI00114CBD33|nr:hypothetical protein [Duganella sp. HH101]
MMGRGRPKQGDGAAPTETAATYRGHMAEECRRACARRSAMSLSTVRGQADQQWGLALSGGGIRSATFCLGVLQALSRIPAAALPAPPGVARSGQASAAHDCLLAQFDYLSTVSGGGYVGSFFGSLFIPGRLGSPTPEGKPQTDQEAAQQAYQVFTCDAPRMREALREHLGTARGRAEMAMAWLRENGRYLSPVSAGDTLYGAATALRAWLGMQYVLGTLLACLFLVLGLAKLAYGYGLAWAYAADGAAGAVGPGGLLPQWLRFAAGPALWCSPLWDLVALLAAAWVAPCILAFWLIYPRPNSTIGDKPDLRAALTSFPRDLGRQSGWLPAVVMAGLILLLSGIAAAVSALHEADWTRLFYVAVAASALMLLAMIWWFGTSVGNHAVIGNHRVVLTRCLTSGLRWSGAVLFVALVDTAAQWLYMNPALRMHWLSQLTLGGVMTWLVHMTQHQIKAGTSQPKLRLPLDLLFGALGLLLAFVLCVLWDMAVLWLEWNGGIPRPGPLAAAVAGRLPLVSISLACALALVLIVAHYPQFLNLSTLSGLYGGRLTRAYHGASNGKRFEHASAAARSSAEPEASDHIPYAAYTRNQMAPMHLINICLNQNVDPSEQLVQRDRKGRPMVILPGMQNHPVVPNIAVDGQILHPDPALLAQSDTLTIGEWVAVSGAAVSSGMGRGTTAAKAFLLGLANVRLGRWWQSGIPAKPDDERNRLARWMRRYFPTQVYLVEELTAHFHGLRRRFHYLSDGGHFDNTGIYELLRPERHIKLILACDCGADPAYQYHDLGVLIRLARIDFGLDLRLADGAQAAALGDAFGSFETMRRGDRDGRCALLLNGYRPGSAPEGAPDVRIVVLKPVQVGAMPGDLCTHAADQPQFPQQTTADQFFDEAQWESYRKLGALIAERVLGAGQAHAAVLWPCLSS